MAEWKITFNNNRTGEMREPVYVTGTIKKARATCYKLAMASKDKWDGFGVINLDTYDTDGTMRGGSPLYCKIREGTDTIIEGTFLINAKGQRI